MIKIINIEDDNWNYYVKKCPLYDPFYLKEYAEAFMNERVENGIPVLIIYESNDDYAINVIFKRDISQERIFTQCLEKGKYYDIISPYGYGGFIGNVTNYSELINEYDAYCRQCSYISEFVRFELFSEYIKEFSGEIESHSHNVVRDLTIPLEEIWMDFKQKVRKNVKRAIANGLEIIIDENGEFLDDFLEVYYETMRRTNAKGSFFFSTNFFQTINKMKDNYAYFHVMYKGKIISTELVIFGDNKCYSYLGGTRSEYFELRPNDFLKYEIIKWAKEKGIKQFILGGGYGDDDGIYRYKSDFAPHGIVDFYIGKRVFDLNNYNMLVELRSKDNPSCINSKYFPKYRD